MPTVTGNTLLTLVLICRVLGTRTRRQSTRTRNASTRTRTRNYAEKSELFATSTTARSNSATHSSVSLSAQMNKYISIECEYEPSFDCISFWKEHRQALEKFYYPAIRALVFQHRVFQSNVFSVKMVALWDHWGQKCRILMFLNSFFWSATAVCEVTVCDDLNL